MARQRSHSIAFKRQVAQEFIAGESLYALSKRHDISRQLIRVWVEKYEAGVLDEDAQAADLLQEYEAKIAALERMAGRQALEIEFLKGALKNAPRPRNVNTSVISPSFYDMPDARARDLTIVAEMKTICDEQSTRNGVCASLCIGLNVCSAEDR